MHRPLGARFPLRSIAESFSHLQGGRVVPERLYYSPTVTKPTGQDVLWQEAESTTCKLQRQIVGALRSGKRDEASNLLLRLSQGNDLKGAEDFERILKYCAKSPDPIFVMEAWRIMNEKEISLNSMCSLLMVQALCNGGYLEEALTLINFLGESHGIYPVLHVYNTFLGACTKMQNMVYANQCLELMERRKVGKDENTYAQLLKLAVWQQNLSVAHELWKDYIKHYSLSIVPLRKFLWSFISLGDLKSASKTLQYMVALVIRGKTSVNKSIKGKWYSSRLDIPIPLNSELGFKKLNLEENEQSVPSRYCKNLNGDAVSADQCTNFGLGFGETESVPVDGLNNHMSTPVMELLRHSFTDLIYACAKLGNGGLAEQLVQQMQKFGFQMNGHVCDGLIRAIVPERGFSSGMEILKSMQQRNLKPYDRTLATLSIDCSKALELRLAETLLDQISKHSHVQALNTFLAACDIMEQPENALRVLAKMKRLQVMPNRWTYEHLFSLFCTVSSLYKKGKLSLQEDAVKRIKAIERDMKNYGIQHSVLSINNLLKALGAEGMMKEVVHYFHVAENLFGHDHSYLGTPLYNTVLDSFVKNKEPRMAIKIFKYMRLCGLSADATTYNIMINCFQEFPKRSNSVFGFVSLMVRDGFYPQTETYGALIKWLRPHSIDEALDLLDQASSEGNKLNTLIFNAVLQKARTKELIPIVEYLVERMHHEKIRPDSGTCTTVFTAYTKSDLHDTAIEALRVLSLRMVCDEDGNFLEKEKFKEYLFSKDAESRIIPHLIDSEENLAFALLNIRWCTFLGSSTSLVPDKSPWAKRLSTEYTARRGARPNRWNTD